MVLQMCSFRIVNTGFYTRRSQERHQEWELLLYSYCLFLCTRNIYLKYCCYFLKHLLATEATPHVCFIFAVFWAAARINNPSPPQERAHVSEPLPPWLLLSCATIESLYERSNVSTSLLSRFQFDQFVLFISCNMQDFLSSKPLFARAASYCST